ncbi:MAG: hypothetical protein QNM02_11275 [Acidimicrobiia bacterium]|nr:hypothetical protein [Acidimicrobiia bacterium]
MRSAAPGRLPAHLNRVLDRCDGVKRNGRGYGAKCPCHDDTEPSLGIAISENDRRVNVKCFAGCDSDDVLRALGLTVADLYPDATRNGVRIERRHPYHDEFGNVLYEVRRLDRSKDRFRTYHPTPDGWKPGRGDADPVLYNLQLILRSAPTGESVFFCEGERDADSMVADEFVATTVPSGSFRNVDTSALKDRLVIACVDNDAGGLFEAVRPPSDCKDVTEMVEKGYCLTTQLIEVDLDTEQPPFENWHRRNDPPIDRSAFYPDGNPVSVQLPSGLLLSHLQAERLKLDDVIVFLLLEERAGKSSLAKMTVADIERVLGWRWHRADASVKRLESVGLISNIKRGHMRVFNPCWPDRQTEHLDRDATYRNRPEPLPPSSPSNPNKSPANRRPASNRPPENVETPPERVDSTFGIGATA